MPNYKLLIEYDGRTFYGWQKQKLTRETIQERLENAIATVTGVNEINLIGAGRTDSGVSAYGQVANFRTDGEIKVNTFLYCVNSILPDAITVRNIELAGDDFHSRYSATSREYIYRCTMVRKSIDRDFYYHIRHRVDFEKVEEFMEFVRSLQYFKSFCKNPEDKREFKCSIRQFDFTMDNNASTVTFKISSDRFLHSMIRSLIGCALDIGRERFDLSEIKQKSLSGELMNIFYLPPSPLFLNKISY